MDHLQNLMLGLLTEELSLTMSVLGCLSICHVWMNPCLPAYKTAFSDP